MKALIEKLKTLQEYVNIKMIKNPSTVISVPFSIKEILELNEAIKELEELKNKKCESCQFIDTAPTDEPCANCRYLHIEEKQ